MTDRKRPLSSGLADLMAQSSVYRIDMRPIREAVRLAILTEGKAITVARDDLGEEIDFSEAALRIIEAAVIAGLEATIVKHLEQELNRARQA